MRVPYIWALVWLSLLCPVAWSQESSSDTSTEALLTAAANDTAAGRQQQVSPIVVDKSGSINSAGAADESAVGRRQGVIASLTIFVLAVFVGFEVITKVPPTLHTPLMSGSNAISGITLVGAVIAAAGMNLTSFIGFVAVTLATINAVGGFLVTHRMLAMFTKK